MRRWVRHFLTFLFIVLFVPAVIFLAGYAWLISGLPDLDGTIEVNGVAAPVEIVRDGRAIPHIFADSPEDAFYALGYVHAQDRLWQMEMSRRAGLHLMRQPVPKDMDGRVLYHLLAEDDRDHAA